MAVVRKTVEEIRAAAPNVDRAKIAATTEADIARHAAADGSEPANMSSFDSTVLVQSVRRQLGMTQVAFAEALRIPLATLRNWEQGRVQPDPAARSLLLIVARNPDAALAALAAKRRRAGEDTRP